MWINGSKYKVSTETKTMQCFNQALINYMDYSVDLELHNWLPLLTQSTEFGNDVSIGILKIHNFYKCLKIMKIYEHTCYIVIHQRK